MKRSNANKKSRSDEERSQMGVQFFATHHERESHIKSIKAKLAEQCSDRNCRRENSCCHQNCVLDDGGDPCAPCDKYRYAYIGFNYDGFTVPQTPVAGVSQVLTTTSLTRATITNYTGVLPTVAADQVQVVFPDGLGFGSGIPTSALLVLSGILDSVYPAQTGAHLLNTLWIVRPSDTPNTWNLRKIRINQYRVGDAIQIRNFMSATVLAPVKQVVRVIDINCPEQTIVFEETSFSDVVPVIPLYVCGISPPKRCRSCSDGGSCGGYRCGALNIVPTLLHPSTFHPSDIMDHPMRRYGRIPINGVTKNEKGRVVRGTIADELVMGKKETSKFLKKEFKLSQADLLPKKLDKKALAERRIAAANKNNELIKSIAKVKAAEAAKRAGNKTTFRNGSNSPAVGINMNKSPTPGVWSADVAPTKPKANIATAKKTNAAAPVKTPTAKPTAAAAKRR